VSDRAYALTVWDGNLIAGGIFLEAGNVPVNRIARWDEESWHALGSGLEFGMGVYALAVYHDDLVAAGQFSSADGAQAINIAAWDGLRWNPLGAGLGGGQVKALAVYHDELYAGGSFQSAGGVPAHWISRWDGATWRPLPQEPDEIVNALVEFGGELIVGGQFEQVGTTVVHKVAAWNGAEWRALGGGLSGGEVDALAVSGAHLFAGGAFTSLGQGTANHAAQWDGTAWHAMGAGLNNSVMALAAFQGELQLGGNFEFNGPNVAAYWARWTDTNIPWIAEQPQDVSTGCRERAAFTVVPVYGYEGLEYQWYRDGQALSDGPTAWNSVISGSNQSVLTIELIGAPDTGDYACVVSNECGSVTSESAVLTSNCCPADFDGDGFVTGVDFDLYVQAFESGDASADFDHDGFVTGVDFDEYVVAFGTGC
jgi:hypothetical protein